MAWEWLPLKWWSKEAKEAEDNHQDELLKLKREKEIKEAKLAAAEIDDDVITARTRMRIIEELTFGIDEPVERERIIRTMGRDLGIGALAKEMNADNQMKVLKALSSDDMEKIGNALKFQKEKMQLLESDQGGFRKSKKSR